MSNVPPPFPNYSAAPPRKDKTGMIVLIVILALVGVCVLGGLAMTWMMFNAAKAMGPNLACQVTYASMHQALKDYAVEHGGTLPSAAKWQEELRPFVEKRFTKLHKEFEDAPDFLNMRIMDPKGDWGCYVEGKKMSGIGFNLAASGKKPSELAAQTPILFEIASPQANYSEAFASPKPDQAPNKARGWYIITWEEGLMRIEDDGTLQDVEMDNDSSFNFESN